MHDVDGGLSSYENVDKKIDDSGVVDPSSEADAEYDDPEARFDVHSGVISLLFPGYGLFHHSLEIVV